jgi:hypothetical protein
MSNKEYPMVKESIDDLRERRDDVVGMAGKSKERRGSTIWTLDIPCWILDIQGIIVPGKEIAGTQ